MMSFSGIVLVVAMAVAGCSNGSPVSPAPTPADAGSGSSGQTTAAQVELRLDETVEHQDLVLRWLELEDSRCPTGVNCIWAGQVVTVVDVARGEQGPVKLELILRAGRQPEPVPAFDHELLLLSVDPHPKEGVTPERRAYVARVEITEPGSR